MVQDSPSIVDVPEGEERRLATEEGTLVTKSLHLYVPQKYHLL